MALGEGLSAGLSRPPFPGMRFGYLRLLLKGRLHLGSLCLALLNKLPSMKYCCAPVTGVGTFCV